MWTNVQLSAWDVLYMHTPSRFLDTNWPSRPLRLVLSNCWLTGVDWFRSLPDMLIKSLLIIHITEMEPVNIGHMDRGYCQPGFAYVGARYWYVEDEAEALSAELSRLGRKYIKPMTDKERRVLRSTLDYYWAKERLGFLQEFPSAVRDIIRTHEPELSALGLDTLFVLSRDYPKVLKLKPLTERLLEALTQDCNYV
ncbi:hypothetical protein RvY_14165 [Ramazzottius varieornatus]|uniref:Uncharacterized protein n=1 Tax=Ramazzottius varieornatus TaxID=947166 RepID=A0A1D1VQD8_RAMVA|nr:hypothetical protein RvY_14165 [Ramazzottius varieornatus]